MADAGGERGGLIRSVVDRFLTSRLSIILIMASLSLGLAAIAVTPREEEPQIVVPLADVLVQVPGSSAQEVEQLVANPLEKLLWQIDGVEYVYSISRPELAIVTVRFFVGQDRERSLVKLHNKINMNIDQVPPVVRGWVVKPVEIDDVPILTLTLHSGRLDDHQLRRVGEELLVRLGRVEDISRTGIFGGRPREVRVELLHERMAGLGVSGLEIERALVSADASVTAGTFDRANRNLELDSQSFLTSTDQVGSLVVGVHQGRPVYLQDVARIIDGPEEAETYSRIGFSRYLAGEGGGQVRPRPAVTLALAKKKGTNAVSVARRILAELESLKKEVVPAGVEVEVTRNYGQTAQRKVDELLSSLFFAILTVVALLAFTLGWREALIVALAVPVSFSLALFVNLLFGYTINRVTMFALILSLGLVVDDPITNVDNIQRHIVLGRRRPREATLEAVSEVLPPVIMSTLAIIVSFAPMFFITGMMGPYMAPMAANVPLTVTFSTVCALTIVPWMAFHLLKRRAPVKPVPGHDTEDGAPVLVARAYRRLVIPFLEHRILRWLLLIIVLILLAGSCSLAFLRQVPLKMLPFDNKNEFQIVLDLPEGTTLEATDRVVGSFERYLAGVPEVTSFVSYTGFSSPMDFNGLVRHYYLRGQPNLADIRVNLALKEDRAQQSHAIVLRLREDLERLAADHGARLKLVEVPPGPPVLSTVVAEVYGPPGADYQRLIEAAGRVEEVMAGEPFVTDIDKTTEEVREKIDFVLDKEKAALHGVSTSAVTQTLRMALAGLTPATIHLPAERQPLLIRLTLPREARSSVADLSQIHLKTGQGTMIPLAELGWFRSVTSAQPILHKNLRPVVYVTAEMAGRPPAEAILDMQARLGEEPLPPGMEAEWAGEGEWEITLSVFRDLGLAMVAAQMGIYILLIIETNSFFLPLLIMMAVPLTLLGIMPGFWLLNLASAGKIGGYSDPVFFTATSMIGMIALGGIVIRNSLVLIDFVNKAVERGQAFKEAILKSGAVRLRPIVLTAATTALGAWPITLDPIFSGLAWALIFGLAASTIFTLLIVPVTYYALYRRRFQEAG